MFTHQHTKASAPDLGVDDSVEQEAARLLGRGVAFAGRRETCHSTRFLGIRDLKIDSARIVAAAQTASTGRAVVGLPADLSRSRPISRASRLMGHFSYRDQVRPSRVAAVNYSTVDGQRRSFARSAGVTQRGGRCGRHAGPVEENLRRVFPEDRAALREAIRIQFSRGPQEALWRLNLVGLAQRIGIFSIARASRPTQSREPCVHRAPQVHLFGEGWVCALRADLREFRRRPSDFLGHPLTLAATSIGHRAENSTPSSVILNGVPCAADDI